MSTKRKLTRWIYGHISPTRPGVYERKYLFHPQQRISDFARFDGTRWKHGAWTIPKAHVKVENTALLPCEFKWRGLASDPAQEKKNGKR